MTVSETSDKNGTPSGKPPPVIGNLPSLDEWVHGGGSHSAKAEPTDGSMESRVARFGGACVCGKPILVGQLIISSPITLKWYVQAWRAPVVYWMKRPPALARSSVGAPAFTPHTRAPAPTDRPPARPPAFPALLKGTPVRYLVRLLSILGYLHCVRPARAAAPCAPRPASPPAPLAGPISLHTPTRPYTGPAGCTRSA